MSDGAQTQPDPATLIRRQAVAALHSLVRPRAYAGVMRECALSAFHVAAYPLGLLPGLRSPRQAGPADGERAGDDLPADARTAHLPVVLVHGYVHNRSAFLVMTRALKRAGFRHVHGFNYNPLSHNLGEVAALLADEVERILEATGADKCMIVGHSMGGIVARHYIQRLGGEDTVDTVITIGAPHRGSFTSYLGLGPAAEQLRPGSQYLRELEESARPSDVRWVAYYSDLDALVVPAVSGKLVHPALDATNLRVRDTGHLSMLLSREVLRSVVAHLSDPGLDQSERDSGLGRLPTAAQRKLRAGAARAANEDRTTGVARDASGTR